MDAVADRVIWAKEERRWDNDEAKRGRGWRDADGLRVGSASAHRAQEQSWRFCLFGNARVDQNGRYA